MKKKTRMIIKIMTLISLILSPLPSAQEGNGLRIPVEAKIAQSPLSIEEGSDDASYAYLHFDRNLYGEVRSQARIVLTGFPALSMGTVDLELERFTVLALGSKIIAGTDTLTPHSEEFDITLLRGSVAGYPDSYAYLALSPMISKGYFTVENKTFSFGPVLRGDRAGSHLLIDVAIDRSPLPFECPESVVTDAPKPPAEVPPLTARAGEFKIADMAVDTDTSFVWLFHNAPDPELYAASYAMALVGASSAIYERDVGIKLIIPYMRIWPIPDPNALEPYPYDDNPNLGEFRDVWNGQMGHVSRTLATLLEGDKDFCGGQGLIDGICTATEGYCSYGMEGCWPDNLPYPILGEGHAGIADIWVMAHETGHVFGGWHTHCYDIDSCASEGSPGEPCYQATTHCRPGTIMSYCYACGGWGFMIMEYHPVVVADMRQTIDAAACMRIARDPVYVDRSNSGLEDGSQTNPYNTVLEGAETALPGGTVLIKPGTYPETFVLPYPCALSRDGSAGTVAVGQQ